MDVLDQAFPPDQCGNTWHATEPCSTKLAFLQGRLGHAEWNGESISGCRAGLCDAYDPESDHMFSERIMLLASV